MLSHYLELAWRSALRAKGLSALMVLALGLGIGACMTTLTVYHVLSGDPIPGKSERLFNVQMEARDMVGFKPDQEPVLDLTRFDATALLREKRGVRQVMTSGTFLAVSVPDTNVKPLLISGRYASSDFFAMFKAPWQFGAGWSAADDEGAARVAVISASLNEKLFGGANSLGREVMVRGQALRVIGVLKPWRFHPHYYDLTLGSYAESEDLFLPFATAMAMKVGHSGNTDCWGRMTEGPQALNAPCAWVQYWVELASPAAAPDYLEHLKAYSETQRAAGRFERPTQVSLRNVMDWLDHQQVLPPDVRLQTWLAFGFLLVCVVNMAGLLLAKTLRRSAEIGVRRALGAGRRDIFAQFVVEAGLFGALGALLGLVLAWGGLWLVRHSPNDYARLAQLDAPMLALTLALALAASIAAGLLPAWRATLVTPASQLKVA